MTSKSTYPNSLLGSQIGGATALSAAQQMDIRERALQMAHVRLLNGSDNEIFALAQRFYAFIVSGDAPPNS